MDKCIRVMMVEDHPEYRNCIKLALEAHSHMKLTGVFGTAERALSRLQEGQVEVPDIILLDLNLPGISGVEAIPGLLAAVPGVRIIVLTQSEKEADILAAISAGASGYLLKSATLDQIHEGIQTVMNGGAPLDSGVARLILSTLQTAFPEKVTNSLLTERELDVLECMADGLVKKEVADKLNISITTVATHVKHIYEKLNVQNAPAAVARAFQMGLFSSRAKK
ncbi:MAG: response regulator transcription factor [Kiritimatiellae bacterium]|nr:response regulator transcription factor [Kiritimatiellia bacterium]